MTKLNARDLVPGMRFIRYPGAEPMTVTGPIRFVSPSYGVPIEDGTAWVTGDVHLIENDQHNHHLDRSTNVTTTAKIAGLSNTKDTGVTPEHAKKMWPKLKSKHMAIVELVVDERGEVDTDDKSLKLAIHSIELADDGDRTEHLRELQRAIYMARQPDKTLTAGVESTPRDVVVRGQDIVLTCERCDHSLGDKAVNHGRREGVQCIHVPCRHTVSRDERECPCGMAA